ncbi:MAG: hypothetical protein Q7T09_10175 [Phenylobacterium sp.]|nr:hypothetical protein [Phenylobacterium sp.]
MRISGRLSWIAGAAWIAAVALAAPMAAQAAPGVDIKVQKSCTLYPANGPTAIVCRIDVLNIGSMASVAPLTIVDQVGGPAGTTYTGSPASTFPCSTAPGALPAQLNCGANLSLAPNANAGAGGSSGSTFVYFKLPPTGGTFKNCATAKSALNPTTPGDVDPSNNTSCASITVPPVGGGAPDLSVVKTCTKGANSSVTCKITIKNNGASASGPLSLIDTLSPVLSGTTYTGASGNVSCGGAGPYTAPVSCTAPPLGGGQTLVVYLSFKVLGKGTFQNNAKVTQGGVVGEANLANNSSSVKVSMP